jgi:hypothetical protein
MGPWTDFYSSDFEREKAAYDLVKRQAELRSRGEQIRDRALRALDPPAVRSSDTSIEAAKAIKTHRPKLIERVYQCIALDGPVTDEEISAITAIQPSTARPRRIELQREGRIHRYELDGRTKAGRRAAMWVTTDH